MATLEQAQAAQNGSECAALFDRDDVVGLGIGKDASGYVLRINLLSPPPYDLPDSVVGVPLIATHIGQPRKL